MIIKLKKTTLVNIVIGDDNWLQRKSEYVRRKYPQ